MAHDPRSIPDFLQPAPGDERSATFLEFGEFSPADLGDIHGMDDLKEILDRLSNMWNCAILEKSSRGLPGQGLARAILPPQEFRMLRDGIRRKNDDFPDDRWIILKVRTTPIGQQRWVVGLTTIDADDRVTRRTASTLRGIDRFVTELGSVLRDVAEKMARNAIPSGWSEGRRKRSARAPLRRSHRPDS